MIPAEDEGQRKRGEGAEGFCGREKEVGGGEGGRGQPLLEGPALLLRSHPDMELLSCSTCEVSLICIHYTASRTS